MVKVIHATYDGTVLLPEETLPFEPNTPLHIVVADDRVEVAPTSFLDTTASLNLEGPKDWSSNLDQYVYGCRIRESAG